MNKNRIIILGIDALEYDLVEEWNLKYLKQKEYGKTIVPLTKTTNGMEPSTLIIWPCFITGEEPEEMGYNSITPNRDILDELYQMVTEKFPNLEQIFKYFHRKSKTRKPTRNNIKAPTIFDNPTYKSIHMHIPIYDEDAFLEYRSGAYRAMDDKKYRKVYENECQKEFRERTSQVYDILDKEWSLCMQYFFLLDGVQHAFFRSKLKIMKYYLMFNEFVGELKKHLPSNVMLLIVSDHGQKGGIHTHYGFYSCNKELGLVNPGIIDFKEIIEHYLNKSE